MSSITDRLLSVEQEFLSAVVAGDEALLAFESRWETLLADLNSTLDKEDLDPEVASVAHATATRIATLADTSIDIFDIYNAHTSLLMNDIDILMSELTIQDPVPEQLSKHRRPRSSRTPSPSTTYGRKRRRTTEINDHVDAFVSKRPRVSAERKRLPASTPCPPLPMLSTIDGSDHRIAPRPTQTMRVTRKRRLSDVSVPSPKRHHCGPRLHAVSDTYLIHRDQDADASLSPKAPVPYSDMGSSADPLVRLDTSIPLDIQLLPTSLNAPTSLDAPSNDDDWIGSTLELPDNLHINDVLGGPDYLSQPLVGPDGLTSFLTSLFNFPLAPLSASDVSSPPIEAASTTPEKCGPSSPSSSGSSSFPSSPSPCPPTPPLGDSMAWADIDTVSTISHLSQSEGLTFTVTPFDSFFPPLPNCDNLKSSFYDSTPSIFDHDGPWTLGLGWDSAFGVGSELVSESAVF